MENKEQDIQDIDEETLKKIQERKLKNVIVKTIRRNKIQDFWIRTAIAAIAAMYAANTYAELGKVADYFDRKKAMKSVIEEDLKILHNKNNRYHGIPDAQGYPRAWGYNHMKIADRINDYYAESQALGDIHLADIADLIEYDENDQNIDKVFWNLDRKYVGNATTFQEYYESLGFKSEEEYYQAMVDLNYEKKLEEQEGVGGPKL